MKKGLMLWCVCCVVAGVTGCARQPAPPREPSFAPQDYSAHSAMNAVDYEGRYLLDGSASGTETEAVELRYGGAFSLAQADGTDIRGRYRWDVTGTVVTLELPNGGERSFWVGEGVLKLVSPKPETEKVFKKQ